MKGEVSEKTARRLVNPYRAAVPEAATQSSAVAQSVTGGGDSLAPTRSVRSVMLGGEDGGASGQVVPGTGLEGSHDGDGDCAEKEKAPASLEAY